MDDITTVRALLWPGLPLWGIFLVAMVTAIRITPQWMEKWTAYLKSKHEAREVREAAKEKARERDWTRLRDEIARLADRCERLEERDEECRRNLAAVREDLAAERAARAKLQAIIDGWGEVRQAAGIAQAEVRVDEAEKAKRKP